jgi:hypothetical protein
LECVLKGSRKGALEEALQAVFNIFKSHGYSNCTGTYADIGVRVGAQKCFE